MEFKQIQELIKLVNKSEIGEIRIKDGDFSITLRSNAFVSGRNGQSIAPVYSMPAPQPAPQMSSQQQQTSQPQSSPAPQQQEKSSSASSKEDSGVTMKSPMIGTFYRSPSPDKEPFVKVGDVVQKGDVLCIIEAMKLFNEIESEYSGKIVKVLAEDSSPVEYDQPLFVIDPNAA